MSHPNILKQAWYKWKSIRLPWRRQWLVGADLAGNTFWEFKDALNANRLRRIVKWKGIGRNYGDVKLSPQWHQWLRHTREHAPSLQEQQFEVSRQAMMKQLAVEADERWKSVPSFLDAPNKQHPRPATGLQDTAGYAPQTEHRGQQEAGSAVGSEDEIQGTINGNPREDGRFKGRTQEKGKSLHKENPWADLRPKGGPSENWQPESWTPGVAQREG